MPILYIEPKTRSKVVAKIELIQHAKILGNLAHDQAGTIPPIILAEYLLQVAVMIEANEDEIRQLKTSLQLVKTFIRRTK